MCPTLFCVISCVIISEYCAFFLEMRALLLVIHERVS